MTELKEIITRQNLHNLAGNRSFGRGEDYFESGLVGPITEKTGVISAKVHGSHTYETRLKIVATPQVYKTILGKPGLAEYRRLAEKEWSRVEEKDGDAAWTEALVGGCSDRLWLELARLREKEHPADAVDVYKRLVDPVIDQKNNEAYAEAFRMVGKIHELMGRLGKPAEFQSYLANLRLRHKPKRNLMKLLDKL